MAHKKKTLSEEELTAIKERAKAAADMPVMDMEFDDAELNLDWDALPPMTMGAPAKAAGAAVSTLPVSGTRPVCIRIPSRVIRAFRSQAEKTGGSYQTIMNRVLREAAAGFL